METKYKWFLVLFAITFAVGIFSAQLIYPLSGLMENTTPKQTSVVAYTYQIGSDMTDKNFLMNNTIFVNSGEVLEIRNSVLDFSELSYESNLITNYGTLVIINSTIISNLEQNHSAVINSNGNLSVIHSKFINKRLRVDINTSQIIFITAVKQDTGNLAISSSQFINYTKAIEATFTFVKTVDNNSFIDCPFGIMLNKVNNTIIRQNSLKNSFITGISVSGNNDTVQDNYIFNERNLIQGSSAGVERHENVKIFVDVTIGISFEGDFGFFINNTIINTFKGFYTCCSSHLLIENNFLSTNSGEREGELQLQSVDFGIIRNNTLLNQWDPIEIYNSRHLIVERNYIENASSGISLEKVDYLRDVSPENITVKDNVLVNAPHSGGGRLKNIQFINNFFDHSGLEISEQSEDILISRNIIYMGHLVIMDSRNVVVVNNNITSNIIGIITFNVENVTLQNNTIYCFTIPVPVPEILFQNSLITIVLFSITIIVVIFFLIRKTRKRKRHKKK